MPRLLSRERNTDRLCLERLTGRVHVSNPISRSYSLSSVLLTMQNEDFVHVPDARLRSSHIHLECLSWHQYK